MDFKDFTTFPEMKHEALELLETHFCISCSVPHAVMLTGGTTPLPLYTALESEPPAVDDELCLLVTDERHVPAGSSESNYGKMRGMISAMGLNDSRVMRVHTGLALDDSANRYNEELASFFKRDGRITLGILGLGGDGHLASLFSMDDLDRGRGHYAIAVRRNSGPDRVSVTRDLLLKAERLVFLVAGRKKAEIVERMRTEPDTVIAGRALKNASARTELWFSEDYP